MNPNAPVSTEQQKTSLKRNVRVGESVSFDNGRVVVTLEAKTGQVARLSIRADESVKIDKPPNMIPPR